MPLIFLVAAVASLGRSPGKRSAESARRGLRSGPSGPREPGESFRTENLFVSLELPVHAQFGRGWLRDPVIYNELPESNYQESSLRVPVSWSSRSTIFFRCRMRVSCWRKIACFRG